MEIADLILCGQRELRCKATQTSWSSSRLRSFHHFRSRSGGYGVESNVRLFVMQFHCAGQNTEMDGPQMGV